MTTVSTALDESLHALIDARLDTIDRMLLGRVPRADRLAIVREVESQIFDQIAEHDPDRLDRDDVLAVLGRLDPPEAYLPEDGASVPSPGAFIPSPRPILPPRASGPASSGKAGGIVGLCALVALVVLLPLCWVLTMATQTDFFFILGLAVTPIFALTASITAIVLAVRARLGHGWAILGLVTGILASLLAVISLCTVVFLAF